MTKILQAIYTIILCTLAVWTSSHLGTRYVGCFLCKHTANTTKRRRPQPKSFFLQSCLVCLIKKSLSSLSVNLFIYQIFKMENGTKPFNICDTLRKRLQEINDLKEDTQASLMMCLIIHVSLDFKHLNLETKGHCI